jgi:microcystin-dependent protein
MSEPFLAEIRMVGFNFAPRGWAFCDGQILPINQNQALYSLLGTAYGGDGRTSFALPDLRGRTPVHVGTSAGGNPFVWGQKTGAERHSLTRGEMPPHTHTLSASSLVANSAVPTDHALAAGSAPEAYRSPEGLAPMGAGTISPVGASQAHENMQPFLAVHFCIALQGLFPSRN